jgi:hypothetical protein
LRKFSVRKKAWVRKSQIHKLQIRKPQKDWVHKPQIRKVPQSPHLRKIRKSNKIIKSAKLWLCRTYLRTASLRYFGWFLAGEHHGSLQNFFVKGSINNLKSTKSKPTYKEVKNERQHNAGKVTSKEKYLGFILKSTQFNIAGTGNHVGFFVSH